MRRLNTSYCCLPVVPVLRYTVLCGDQTRPSAGVRNRHSGVVLFSRCCRCVFAGQCRQILSVVSCLFLSPCLLTGFLCVWSETVNLKVNTSVDELDSAR